MATHKSLLSSSPCRAPIHAVAWFRGALNAIPSNRESGLSARRLIDDIAPEEGPRHVRGKADVPYFVPAELRVAPYVRKTAEKHPGQSGYQRSASHVVSGSWFAFDLDELDGSDWSRVEHSLTDSGALFCAYSSYSYGEKPGVRARVLLFMDRALDPLDWSRAWTVGNERLLLGLADTATKKLSQQAGAWATHPGRVERAFRITGGSALLSADALLALAGPSPRRVRRGSQRACPISGAAAFRGGLVDPTRVEEALKWLDADDYATWMAACMGLRAGVRLGDLPEPVGRDLWMAFSERAGADAKTRNDDTRYDPEAVWENASPGVAPPEALFATIFARARDNTTRLVRAAIRENRVTQDSRRAAEYLGRHHRALVQTLLSEANQ